jgi:hypothetical protein
MLNLAIVKHCQLKADKTQMKMMASLTMLRVEPKLKLKQKMKLLIVDEVIVLAEVVAADFDDCHYGACEFRHLNHLSEQNYHVKMVEVEYNFELCQLDFQN